MGLTTEYYDATATKYDELHGEDQNPEHLAALERIWPFLGHLGLRSALDVGCGTGRALRWLEQRKMELYGVDPSVGQLEVCRTKVGRVTLRQGRGEELPFEDNSVDLVLATGIMHHADNPQQVIREMFRVARTAVLISDHNNFAFGGSRARRVRMLLNAIGLLGVATFVKQGFRKQGYSEEDGWWYPYSLLNDYALISNLARNVMVVPTRPSSLKVGNLLESQSHLAIVGFKA